MAENVIRKREQGHRLQVAMLIPLGGPQLRPRGWGYYVGELGGPIRPRIPEVLREYVKVITRVPQMLVLGASRTKGVESPRVVLYGFGQMGTRGINKTIVTHRSE